MLIVVLCEERMLVQMTSPASRVVALQLLQLQPLPALSSRDAKSTGPTTTSFSVVVTRPASQTQRDTHGNSRLTAAGDRSKGRGHVHTTSARPRRGGTAAVAVAVAVAAAAGHRTVCMLFTRTARPGFLLYDGDENLVHSAVE